MNAELFKRYAEDVQERFGLSREQMFAKKKQQEYVDARQMLYLLCDRSGMRISYIERYMKEIEEALIQTVEAKNGTAKRLRTEGVKIAAKTGSAQNSKYKEPHSWVSGYFPADNPKIAFTAFVEGGGSGGKGATEVAKIFVDAYLEKEKNKDKIKGK